jgi:hypothetical protein
MVLEVSWDGLWTLSFGLSQFHGHGSWLLCEVALSCIHVTSIQARLTFFPVIVSLGIDIVQIAYRPVTHESFRKYSIQNYPGKIFNSLTLAFSHRLLAFP